MISADVVINGVGIAGALSTYLLAKAGLQVIALHGDVELPAHGGEILKPKAIQTLDDHGILTRLSERGAITGHAIRYHHDRRLLFQFDFRQHTQLGYFLIARYHDIVASIAEQCKKLLNVELIFGADIQSLVSHSGHVRSVVLKSGTEIRADVFINTVPAPSPFHTAIGARTVHHEYLHEMWVAEVPASSDRANELYFSSQQEFCYIYPLPSATRVFVGLPAGSAVGDHGRDVVDRLAHFVTGQSRHLAALKSARLQRISFGAVHADRYCAGNVVLLGRGAWACHPMAGQGMSITLEDAKAIAQAVTSAGTYGPTVARALAEVCAVQRPAHVEMMAYGDALAASFSDPLRYRQCFDPRLHGDMARRKQPRTGDSEVLS